MWSKLVHARESNGQILKGNPCHCPSHRVITESCDARKSRDPRATPGAPQEVQDHPQAQNVHHTAAGSKICTTHSCEQKSQLAQCAGLWREHDWTGGKTIAARNCRYIDDAYKILPGMQKPRLSQAAPFIPHAYSTAKRESPEAELSSPRRAAHDRCQGHRFQAQLYSCPQVPLLAAEAHAGNG